jgi:hypothetical protein
VIGFERIEIFYRKIERSEGRAKIWGAALIRRLRDPDSRGSAGDDATQASN